MTTFNTGNPVPSMDVKDLLDNSQSFDDGMHGQGDTFKDRFGRDRYTWHRFETITQGALDQVGVTVSSAKDAVNAAKDAGISNINISVAAVDSAEAAAKADMLKTAAELGDDLNNKRYATYAAMLADPQTRDRVVGVVDGDPNEELNGWYSWAAGLSVWQRFEDQPAMASQTLSAVQRDAGDSGFTAVFSDTEGRVAMGFDDQGDAHFGAIEIETRSEKDLYPKVLKPVLDEGGRVVDGYDPLSGKSYAVPIALDAVNARLDAVERAAPSPGIFDEAYPSASVNGLLVTLGGELHKDRAKFPISGAVSITPTSSAVAPPLNTNLLYNAEARLTIGVSGDGSNINVKHVSNVVVKCSADNVILTEGVDYSVFPDSSYGAVTGLVSSAASTPVTITFNYVKERYDVIQLNTETLAVQVVSGQERNLDSHEDFYRAKTTDGCIALYSVYVVGQTVTVVDASAWMDGYPGRLHSSRFPAIRQHAQRCLARVMGKLSRGQTIRLAAYGDSITAQGNGTFYDYFPNGLHRDRTEHYGTLYPYDTRALAGLFDLGDGAGLKHVKTGYVWTVKSFLENRFGVSINYDNWGIGSTRSFPTEGHGLWPARFTPVLDSKPDLTIVAFGMNELGNATTYANVRSIAEQLIAAGSDVIVMGVPRRNGRDAATENIEAWRYTNRALRRAALDAGAAYAPIADVADDPYVGYLGIAPNTLCSTNMINHPGYRELDLYGKVICALF